MVLEVRMLLEARSKGSGYIHIVYSSIHIINKQLIKIRKLSSLMVLIFECPSFEMPHFILFFVLNSFCYFLLVHEIKSFYWTKKSNTICTLLSFRHLWKISLLTHTTSSVSSSPKLRKAAASLVDPTHIKRKQYTLHE